MIPVLAGGVLAAAIVLTPAAEPLERSGVASWFAAPAGTAAAGPELRQLLGKDWRGQHVRVTAAGRDPIIVKLTDWCQCYRGEKRERLIDLSRSSFSALADLSRGLIRVDVSRS